MNAETTTINLICHGEPVGGPRYRDQIDDPLSDLGWLQMRAAVGVHRPWSEIVTSPLSRCAAFAQELGTRLGLPVVEDARLQHKTKGSSPFKGEVMHHFRVACLHEAE